MGNYSDRFTDFSVIVVIALGVFVAFGALSLLLAFPVKWLWNFVVPDVTRGALTEITFWQSFCGSWLCSFLFKGGSHSSGKSR